MNTITVQIRSMGMVMMMISKLRTGLMITIKMILTSVELMVQIIHIT